MFCSKCGNGVNDDNTYCPQCGNHLYGKYSLRKANKAVLSLVSLTVLVTVISVPFVIEYFTHKNDWRDAQGLNTIYGYEIYTRKWPNGEFHEVALKEIEALKEEAHWVSIEVNETIEAYHNFTTVWPLSRRTAQAVERSWGITQSLDSIGSYRKFIELFSTANSHYTSSAESRIREIEEDLAWLNAKGENTKASYRVFLDEWGASRYVDDALEKIAMLERLEERSYDEEYIAFPRPFTFNVPGDYRDRLVQVKAMLRVSENNNLRKHIALAEGVFLRRFSNLTAEELMEPENAMKLKSELKRTLDDTGYIEGLREVLFVGFVMQ